MSKCIKMRLQIYLAYFQRKNIPKYFLSRFIQLIAFLWAVEWIVDWIIVLEENGPELQKIGIGEFDRPNIKNLIKKMSEPIKFKEKFLSREKLLKLKNNKGDIYKFEKAICTNLILIEGERNKFRICYPTRILWRLSQIIFSSIIKMFTGNYENVDNFPGMAYFINGKRDELFERKMARIIKSEEMKLKIFTKENGTNEFDFNKNLEIQIYTENKILNKIGIKDLIDLEGDNHRVEFLKFEMQKMVDPIVFSVNIPIYAAHLLLRLEQFPQQELFYLVKRLEYSMYLLYSIEYDPILKTHFAAFIHKYSMHKYYFDGTKSTIFDHQIAI